ncbi:9673_t:CDS:2 [Dentiscutata erythropus]|uniref:9673_t:CDS:1 n=1 Tax=Dentiscutata erythropus TaxID=1348616 RepID=A0A9N8VKR1_9GLOM|nr:9673_t:CDS:2 [Dentiscutata erythropus]
MEHFIRPLFILGLLTFLISCALAACDYTNPYGCVCPMAPYYTGGGLTCGGELSKGQYCSNVGDISYGHSDIWQCAPNGTSICRLGPCTYGCCGTSDGNSFCCADAQCTGCLDKHASARWYFFGNGCDCFKDNSNGCQTGTCTGSGTCPC